jgi:pto-interacting protein 1
LEEITNNFSVDALIRKGSYARVYYGIFRSGVSTAIKYLYSLTLYDRELLAEVSAIARLKHENLVELIGYCSRGYHPLLAYEYASNGSLHDILHGRRRVRRWQRGPVLSWSRRVKIALGAAKGLRYMHEQAQSHGGVKSSNIFLFDNDVAKIGDFDYEMSNQAAGAESRGETGIISRRCGFHAPEYTWYIATLKSDVYSFGVVLLELLSGRDSAEYLWRPKQVLDYSLPLIKKRKLRCLVDSRLELNYPLDSAFDLASLVARCVEVNPKDRPSMTEVVEILEQHQPK